MLCYDCGKSFSFTTEQLEMRKNFQKFKIVCPICGGEDILISANIVASH
jgi:hypothetical protein